MNSLSLYIHFPYCLYKCHYCDFNSYAVEWNPDLEFQYQRALLQEIHTLLPALPPFQIRSIFLGGGTPSLFSPASFQALFEDLRSFAPWEPDCEITVEINPKTLTAEKIEGYRQAGINRFSVGIQSFQDKFLSPLGRLHNGADACRTLNLLSQVGGLNFNADLMFGFPHQTQDEVLQDLKQALEFGPPHLSFYHLTLEEGTLIRSQYKKGKILLPEPEIEAQMYEQGIDFLTSRGYAPYEISNFALPFFKSRHNLAYWHYEDYLGLGAGAVSFLRSKWLSETSSAYGFRWKNALTPQAYLRSSQDLLGQRKMERIDFQTAQSEFWMMGLRLSEGIGRAVFYQKFGKDLWEIYGDVLQALEKKEWIELRNDTIKLTRFGRMFADDVILSFIV